MVVCRTNCWADRSKEGSVPEESEGERDKYEVGRVRDARVVL